MLSLGKKVFCAAVFAACTLIHAQAVNDGIRLNSIGFLPDYQKKATIKGSASGEFTVVNAAGGAVVKTGALGAQARNGDTNEELRIADFSDVTEPGRYYLDVAGVGRSAEFAIGDSVFAQPYKVMMLGMYLWRCGTAVNATYNGETYSHAACHTAAARTTCQPKQVQSGFGPAKTVCDDNGPTDARDGARGWHDAGDYNRYMVNSGVSTGLMLKAWEQYSDALGSVKLLPVQTSDAYPSDLPQFLAEVKWNLDWVAKMQFDDGAVSHKLSSSDFSGEILPENDLAVQYFSPGGTESAGSFVGQMALASRIYADYAPTEAAAWLEKAKKSYDWLSNNTGFLAANLSGFNTGTYSTTDKASYNVNYDTDKRLWGAVELWEATGESQYLTYFENLANANISKFGDETEWGEKDGVNALAYLTYLTSKKSGKSPALENSIKTKLITLADALADSASKHAYGRTFGSANYYWGGHGALTATTYILNTAYAVSTDSVQRQKYREAGHSVLGHILGRNYYNRSFVTGVGHNPPKNVHDRRSQATNKQWPGYLIGGPHNFSGAPTFPVNLGCGSNPDATCWNDNAADYWTNEIAINWNTSMIYALAGYLPGAEQQPVSVRQGPKVSAKSAAPKIKTSRLVQVRNGRAMDIPVGAKVYSLNGRLVAHRKIGDANIPSIKRNGVFIMRIEEQITK